MKTMPQPKKNELILIKCTFSKGAFAHDREFTVELPSGEVYKGLANIEYCYIKPQQKLKQTEATDRNKSIPGFICAKFLGEVEGKLIANYPDGENGPIDDTLIEQLDH